MLVPRRVLDGASRFLFFSVNFFLCEAPMLHPGVSNVSQANVIA